MTEGTYGIRGLPRPSGVLTKTRTIPFVTDLPLRREISTLAESRNPSLRKQWTLFVLALERFKAKPIDDKLSYFRIAGLHGYPGQPWDNAPLPTGHMGKYADGADAFDGYCNHNRLNFPTWHRPYILLFEQCIWENMKAVLHDWVENHGFPQHEASQWYAEADEWRMPYWDWARRQTYDQDLVYPAVLVSDRVMIYPPDSIRKIFPADGLYENPLLGFQNPEKDANGRSRPFGDLPLEKRPWNIKDNPAVHGDELPKIDDKDAQWFPWSQTSATSRYGIHIDHENQGFMGLEGVNNPQQANKILSAFGKENLWYEPRKDGKDDDKIHSDLAVEELKKDPEAWWSSGTLSDAVNRMFSPGYNSRWEHFASTKCYGQSHPDDRTGYLSLEYIHNNVHNIAGGASWADGLGHMSDVPVAAFDPLFWLHHCQMDRLLAIWQSLYWDLWWDQSTNALEADGPATFLQPFHTKDDGDVEKDVWTSEMCRDWTDLNYQYDDLWSLSQHCLRSDGSLNEVEYREALRTHLDLMYPGTGDVIQKLSLESTSPSEDSMLQSHDLNWADYIINVVYDRYALEGLSYTIEFYLSSPSSDPEEDFDKSNYVGMVYTFSGGSRPADAPCGNCKAQKKMGVLSCGQVLLTIPLLHHAMDPDKSLALKDFSASSVEEYLRTSLRWRFVQFGGAKLSPALFPKTRIEVLRGTGECRSKRLNATAGSDTWDTGAAGSPLAVYSDYTPLPGVTDGKPWGLKSSARRHSQAAHLARL